MCAGNKHQPFQPLMFWVRLQMQRAQAHSNQVTESQPRRNQSVVHMSSPNVLT